MPIQLPAFPLNGTARLCQLLLPLALCAVPVSNQAAALNDTGITFCAGAAADPAATSTANSAVTTAAATKATAFTALATAAAKVNADATTAITSAAAAKTAAAAALTSATTAQTTAATATTAGVAMPATATTTAQAIFIAADTAHTAANNNATTIAANTATLMAISGIAYTAAATATAANAAVPTAVQVAKDAATINAAKATQANTDAANTNALANTGMLALAHSITCTPVAPATTCTIAVPPELNTSKTSIETAATNAAAAADASHAAQLSSDSAAFASANSAAVAANNAALMKTAYPVYFTATSVAADLAKDSTAKAALSAKAATAAAIAATDASTAATAASKAAADAVVVTNSITTYNDAKTAYDNAVIAYNVALAAANAPVDTAAAAAAKAAADAANCVTISSDSGAYPRQDARYGRDAETTANTLPKTGGGRAGFDFTRIANNGVSLPAAPTTFPITTPPASALGTNPTDWACTKDNVTGLVWEIKTQTLPRSVSLTYTWYNSNAATNGGAAGTANGGDCLVAGRCDTEKYVADVNAAALCGFTDWRLPTIKELESLADFSGANAEAAVDATYFPNTSANNTWASSPLANYSSFAWSVYFKEGNANFGAKSNKYAVRLVRGGQ